MARPIVPPDNVDKFWNYVHVQESGCWLWTGAVSSTSGYGSFSFPNHQGTPAHRVSWIIHHGDWPEEQVLHTCDNRLCVNPSHLWEGTQSDNLKDAYKKGRLASHIGAKGEDNPNAKLTNGQVEEIKGRIKRGEETLQQISEDYPVTRTTISRIKSGHRHA